MGPLKHLYAAIIVCASSLGGCGQPTEAPKAERDPTLPMDTLGKAHHFVSFYKLLARPEDFDRKPVQVHGVLSIGSEDNVARLYPNADALRYFVTMDALSLQFSDEQWRRFAKLDGRFVAIEGEFRRITAVDDWIEAGTLQVTRLVDLSSLYDEPSRGDKECHELNPAIEQGLSDAATSYLQKAASVTVRLEPLCVKSYVSTEVRAQPTVGPNGVSSRYQATCHYAAKWSCQDLEASREIAVTGREPVRVTWDVEPADALNVVEFLNESAVNGGLHVTACGMPERRFEFNPGRLKALTRVFRSDPPSRDIVAQFERGHQIWFGPTVTTPRPDVSKLCWNMLIAD